MRVLLAGGLLAQGIRPAATEQDRLWEKAAWARGFFKAYGWDWQQLRDCPFWLRDRLMDIENMIAEIEKEQIERAS